MESEVREGGGGRARYHSLATGVNLHWSRCLDKDCLALTLRRSSGDAQWTAQAANIGKQADNVRRARAHAAHKSRRIASWERSARRQP